ncbi:MAG: YitT family protein [Heyndrickxia sp.]
MLIYLQKTVKGEISILKIAAVFIGSLLLSIGINGFLVPHRLLDGGVTGLALILHYYYGFPTGFVMILLSIPLFIYVWTFERISFYESLFGLIVASLIIDWLEPLRTQFLFSIFPSVLLGGGFIGIGVGIMLRYGVSTGGTDLLAKILSRSFSLDIGLVILALDGFIVAVGFNTLGFKAFFFSCLTICLIGIIVSLLVKPSSS